MEQVRELWSAYVDKTMVFFPHSPSIQKKSFPLLVMKKRIEYKNRADVFVCKFYFFPFTIISAFASVKVLPLVYKAVVKKCKLIESVEGWRGIKTGKFFLHFIIYL